MTIRLSTLMVGNGYGFSRVCAVTRVVSVHLREDGDGATLTHLLLPVRTDHLIYSHPIYYSFIHVFYVVISRVSPVKDFVYGAVRDRHVVFVDGSVGGSVRMVTTDGNVPIIED